MDVQDTSILGGRGGGWGLVPKFESEICPVGAPNFASKKIGDYSVTTK